MSVRHIDYFKLSSSKFLPVEIRPVKCLLDTPGGTTRTAKWMTHDHWKELRLLICEIADDYEEGKRLNKVTQDVKCNEHKLKDGLLLKIGYMFVPYSSCRCNFLVPREDATWSDDEDDVDDDTQELRDKGGRYSSITPSGEMLVVSVRLQDQKPSSRTPSVPASPMTADKLLMKALNPSFVITNTISDYFASSQKDLESSLPSLSSVDNSNSDKRITLKNIVGKSCQRGYKRANASEGSENKRPSRRQVKSDCNTSEESVVGSDSVILNHRYIHEKLSFVQEKEVSIKTEGNECDGESLMAGKGLVNSEINQAFFDIKREDSDVSIGEEQLESGDFYCDVHVSDFACNLPDAHERCIHSADASGVYVTENFEGSDHNFFKRETHFELDSRSARNLDNVPLADDNSIIERIKEEPEDCMNSYNRLNTTEKQGTLSFVRKNDETDFYSHDKSYVSVSEPQEYFSSSCNSVTFSQIHCDNSSIKDKFTYYDRDLSLESEEEITRSYKIRVSHKSSSSSQVAECYVNTGEDSDEAGQTGKGSDQEEEAPAPETPCSSNEPFLTKIPLDFLERESSSLSKTEMSSPSRNKGRTSQRKVLELFGEHGDSNDALERDANVPKWGNCDNHEEEYIPQPLVKLNDSQTTCSDYSPNSVKALGCRRSKRIQSRYQKVLDEQSTSASTDITSENKNYSGVVSKRTNKEKKRKNNSKTLNKCESSNKLITKANRNMAHCMAIDVNKRMEDNSSEDEHEFKPESKSKKLKTVCKEKKKNVKESDKEKRKYQKIFNLSQLFDNNELVQDLEFRNEIPVEKKRSQNTKGRKKPLHEKKKGGEKLHDGKPRATNSKGKRQSCQSRVSAVLNAKKIREARIIIRKVEKDIEAGRKLLSKDPYLDFDSDVHVKRDAVSECGNKKSGPRKKRNGKKGIVPANQPTLEECLFAKSLAGTSSKRKPRPSEKEDLFADSMMADVFQELGESVSSEYNCDGEKSFETVMSVRDLVRAEEKEKLLIGTDNEFEFEDLPDFSNLGSLHNNNSLKSHGAGTSAEGREPVNDSERNCQLNSGKGTEKVVFMEEKSQKVSQTFIKSCHNKICNMSYKELQNRLEESIDFFQSIIDGRLPNHLHNTFQKNSCRHEFSEEIFWPFSEEQIDITYKFLENYTAKLHQAKYLDIYPYIWRVLCPSFFIKVVMDMESVDRETALYMLQRMPEQK